jgi:TonB family protein
MSTTYFLAGRQCLAAVLLLLLGSGEAAWGQKGESVYAAPGMPVMLARRPPARVAPVIKPWLSDPLPRFGKGMDSLTHRQNINQLFLALKQRVRYPEMALRSQVEGTVYVRILVNPDGTPRSVSVLKTAFMPALADRKASEDLEVEALRAAQLLRFQPKAGGVDTVTFPVVYRIQ